MTPEVEWFKFIGMRNVQVHGYFDIDAEIVWETASQDVPALKSHIEQLLHRLEDPA